MVSEKNDKMKNRNHQSKKSKLKNDPKEINK
jgi:hypothetical protein